jgi:hypothetical protein
MMMVGGVDQRWRSTAMDEDDGGWQWWPEMGL